MHINCINELTNSDVFHVFYYFPFCMYVEYEMLTMWRIVESFPPDIILVCCVWGIMRALNKIPSARVTKESNKSSI